MESTLQKLVNSMSPYQLATVQSATCARDLTALGNNYGIEIPKLLSQPHQIGGIVKAKKDNNQGKGKNSRPLNSFMAFRCYYSVLFTEFEQKVISTYIVFLWEHDVFKAKWALAAKAYSIIRDHVGKEHAPLDIFLTLVADLLGLIKPQCYLAVMGWEISVNEHGSVSLAKTAKVEVPDHDRHTNISTEDIVAYACQHGYVGDLGSIVMMPNHQPVLAMAASAQLHGKNEENIGQNDQHIPDQVATLHGMNGNAAPASNTSRGAFNYSTSTNDVAHNYLASAAISSPGFQQFADSRTASTNTVPNITVSNSQTTPAGNSTTLTNIANTNSANSSMGDGILSFDPATTPNIFEPTKGDQWDAFDISSWINQDAFAN